jgi:hypothetical protein
VPVVAREADFATVDDVDLFDLAAAVRQFRCNPRLADLDLDEQDELIREAMRGTRFEKFVDLDPLPQLGDVANILDPLYGRRRRIEHWSNADYQGSELGRILAGRPGGYDSVASFFSEVFGRTIKVFGDTSRFDELEEVGTLDDGFLATYAERGRLVGAITVGHSDELDGSRRRSGTACRHQRCATR